MRVEVTYKYTPTDIISRNDVPTVEVRYPSVYKELHISTTTSETKKFYHGKDGSATLLWSDYVLNYKGDWDNATTLDDGSTLVKYQAYNKADVWRCLNDDSDIFYADEQCSKVLAERAL